MSISGGVGAGGFGRTSTMSPVSTLSTLSSISSSSSVASSTSNASSVSGNSRQVNLRKTSSTMPAPQRPTCGIPKRSPNSQNIHSDGSSSIGRMISKYICIQEIYPEYYNYHHRFIITVAIMKIFKYFRRRNIREWSSVQILFGKLSNLIQAL